MSKKFLYHRIDSNLNSIIVRSVEDNCLYVFPTNEAKKSFLIHFQQRFEPVDIHAIDISDFTKMSFLEVLPLVSDIQREVFLFSLLTHWQKLQLYITDYSSFLDFSKSFFGFWEDVAFTDYSKVLSENLSEWQVEKFQLYENIKSKYQKLIREKGYSDRIFSQKITDSFGNYKKIHFVGVVEFSNQTKAVIEYQAQTEKEIIFHLAIPKQMFDEQNLALKEFSPEQFKTLAAKKEISIYKANNSIEQYTKLLKNSKRYDGIFNLKNTPIDYPIEFANKRFIYFSSSEDFKLLTLLNELIYSQISDKKGRLFPIPVILKISKNGACKQLLCNSFDRQAVLKDVFALIDRGYRFIDEDLSLLDSISIETRVFLEVLFQTVSKIGSLTEINSFIEYFSELKLTLSDFKNGYFESLLQLKALDIKTKDIHLFELFIRILSKIRVTFASNAVNILELLPFRASFNISLKRVALINFTSDIHSKRHSTSPLMNENIAQTLGLTTQEKSKTFITYSMIRMLLTTKATDIYTISNADENLQINSIIHKIAQAFDIEIKSCKTTNYRELLRVNCPCMDDFIVPQKTANFSVIPAFEKFPKKWSYSSTKQFVENPFEFYLERIIKVKARKEPEDEFSATLFGTFTHQIFAQCFREIEKKQTKIEKVNSSFVKEVIEDYLKNDDFFRLASPKNFAGEYFKAFAKKDIRASILAFLKEVQKQFTSNIDKIYAEKSLSNCFHDKFQLFGILDLVVESGLDCLIYDFKTTGMRDNRQLDFYEKLVFESTKKSISSFFYEVLTKKLYENSGRSELFSPLALTMEKVRKTGFFSTDKSRYPQICRLDIDVS